MDFKEVSELLEVSKDGPWLAGGSVRKHVLGLEQDSDYDIWFKEESTLDYQVGLLMEQDPSPDVNGFRFRFTIDGTQLDLMTNLYEDVDCVLKSFDFTVCQWAWDGSKIYKGPMTLQDNTDKVLRLIPECTRIRAALHHSQKYIRRGYSFDTETMDRITLGRNPDVEGSYDEAIKARDTVTIGPAAGYRLRGVEANLFGEVADQYRGVAGIPPPPRPGQILYGENPYINNGGVYANNLRANAVADNNNLNNIRDNVIARFENEMLEPIPEEVVPQPEPIPRRVGLGARLRNFVGLGGEDEIVIEDMARPEEAAPEPPPEENFEERIRRDRYAEHFNLEGDAGYRPQIWVNGVDQPAPPVQNEDYERLLRAEGWDIAAGNNPENIGGINRDEENEDEF